MPVRRRGGGLLLSVAALAAAGCSSASPPPSHHAADPPARHAAASARSPRLRVLSTRALPAPVQLPGLARAGGPLLAAGGRNASDTSVGGVARVAPRRPRTARPLPAAVPDAAATPPGA